MDRTTVLHMCGPQKSYDQKCFQQSLNSQPSDHEAVLFTTTLIDFDVYKIK
jgi:hypothetical protein